MVPLVWSGNPDVACLTCFFVCVWISRASAAAGLSTYVAFVLRTILGRRSLSVRSLNFVCAVTQRFTLLHTKRRVYSWYKIPIESHSADTRSVRRILGSLILKPLNRSFNQPSLRHLHPCHSSPSCSGHQSCWSLSLYSCRSSRILPQYTSQGRMKSRKSLRISYVIALRLLILSSITHCTQYIPISKTEYLHQTNRPWRHWNKKTKNSPQKSTPWQSGKQTPPRPLSQSHQHRPNAQLRSWSRRFSQPKRVPLKAL